MAELTQDQFVDYIKNISVLELSQLVKRLEQELGVSARRRCPWRCRWRRGRGGPRGGRRGEDEFDVILTDFAPRRSSDQGRPRGHQPGLKEAKDLVEGVPKPIKEGVPKAEAETIKKKFEDVGAKAEIK